MQADFPSLAKMLTAQLAQRFALLTLPVQADSLSQSVRYQMQIGGKYIRPLATLLGCIACGGKPEASMGAALAVELLHNFTLVHDDIMDNAPLRRGQPTIHALHGIPNAILSGDALFVLAYQHLLECPGKEARLMAMLNKAALEVCDGQQLDMDFEHRADVSRAEYLRMIELKTSVLLATAFAMGAMCANAKAEVVDMLYAFGLEIGLTFQLTDDYLDAYGDSAQFGKVPGGDILARKKTLLWLTAVHDGPGNTLELMENILDGALSDAQKVERILLLFDSANVPEVCQKAIAHHSAAADHLLAQLPLPPAQKQVLEDFAAMLRQRTY